MFGTLEVFGTQEDGVSLTDLRKITQLPLTKLKVVLALLKKAGFIEAVVAREVRPGAARRIARPCSTSRTTRPRSATISRSSR